MAVLTINEANAADAVAGIDLYSARVWRGITLNDGMVLQPWMDLSVGNATFGVWANRDMNDYKKVPTKEGLSQIDLSLFFNAKLFGLESILGFTEYIRMDDERSFDTASDTRDVFAGILWNAPGGITLSLKSYYDFGEYNDIYAAAGAGYSFSLLEDTFAVDLNATVGYMGKERAQGKKAGLNDISATATLIWSAASNFAVSLTCSYVDNLDSAVLPNAVLLPEDSGTNALQGYDVDFFWGAKAAYSF